MTVAKKLKALAQFGVEDVRVELGKERDILKGARQRKPLVAYAGWTGHGNLGDELLFEAHKALFPRLYFVPLRSMSPANVYGGFLGKSRYVAGFLGGGTLINQSPAWLKRMQYIQAKGLPTYCFGTGVTEDTFRFDFENTSLSEWATGLEAFTFVGIRGPRSQELLQSAGFMDAKIIGDTALALAPEKMKRHTANGIIGFNYGMAKKTRLWGDGKVYTERIADTIRQLIAAGNEVRLLPVWAEDIESNQELLAMVDNPKCTMRVCFDSLESYTKELDACGLFIGQKLHATIMACMERIPSIMIEYQPKCRDFMKSVDMEEYVVKTSDCTPENLLQGVASLTKRYDDVRKRLEQKVASYRTLQYELARQIEDELLEGKGYPV